MDRLSICEAKARFSALDEAESLRRSLKVTQRVKFAALIGTGRR